MTSSHTHRGPIRSSPWHLTASVGLAGAGAIWLLHYPLRRSCPEGYVQFDLGIPAAVGVLCLVVAVEQAFRVRKPSRRGVAARALVALAAVIAVVGTIVLHGDLTGSYSDCWTF